MQALNGETKGLGWYVGNIRPIWEKGGGRRLGHAPTRGGCRGGRNSCVWEHGLPYVGDFSLGG